ncbi:Xaa-Pro aminopeptidase [Hahella sp. CCB-MM4]|uniref:Xaa-Pro aminopeptidase n=1 Tax=Hahella sp. (strain CCB-MM4) TaxID=1926491 RepID=UPI000B9BD7D8|nr:Xaa-Pro aminopeptidase [Hahella sp. CCB-MM4]OZG74903.1 Xaa-Pro aminopeptidase [Hahella sp. CCB-MM4]
MQISVREYQKRRRHLLDAMAPNSIAILPAAPVRPRNRDVEYPFRQNSDFYYLSGLPEPDAVIVLIPEREHGESILFCKEKDPDFERWNGTLVGQEDAISELLFDDAFPINDIDDILPGLMEGRNRVYYSMGLDEKFDRHVMEWINILRSKVRSGAHPPDEFVALEHTLHDMRLFKSPAEIKVMRQAGKISAKAHCEAMKICKPGLYEYQLEGAIQHVFMQEGARFNAYPSIVGGGANACVLHYITNSAKLKSGDLVLIDAGCELDCYAADITRTFPVSGKFTAEQKTIYEIVLASQYAAIEEVKAGHHWNNPHEAAVRVITEGLLEIGLLQGELKELIETEAYKKFYMHRTGHWLGMDVHDVGDYKIGGEWRVLEPGMVMTVEPGIYIAPELEDIDERWRGIGIRIEDDVLVTKQAPEIFTRDVPKDIDDIEALMRGK